MGDAQGAKAARPPLGCVGCYRTFKRAPKGYDPKRQLCIGCQRRAEIPSRQEVVDALDPEEWALINRWCSDGMKQFSTGMWSVGYRTAKVVAKCRQRWSELPWDEVTVHLAAARSLNWGRDEADAHRTSERREQVQREFARAAREAQEIRDRIFDQQVAARGAEAILADAGPTLQETARSDEA